MIIVHVDDMLLATNNNHRAESHISRLLSKNDVEDVKRAEDDGGVLYRGKQVRMVPDSMKPGGLALQQDQTGFVKSRCEPASMSRVRARQNGRSVHDKRNSRDAKYDRELALGKRMNTSRRVIRDKSVAEVTISTPGVRSQARCTSRTVPEESARNWSEV